MDVGGGRRVRVEEGGSSEELRVEGDGSSEEWKGWNGWKGWKGRRVVRSLGWNVTEVVKS